MVQAEGPAWREKAKMEDGVGEREVRPSLGAGKAGLGFLSYKMIYRILYYKYILNILQNYK